MNENIQNNEHPSQLPKSWTTVTTFSKIVALILFIVLPFAGFYYGLTYQIDRDTKTKTLNTEAQLAPTENPQLSTPPAGSSFYFSTDFSSITSLLLSPDFSALTKKSGFTHLSCLQGLPDNISFEADDYTLSEIKKLQSPENLIRGVESLYEHEFEVKPMTFDENGKIGYRGESSKQKANVKIFSICSFSDGYAVLFNTVFNRQTNQQGLTDFVPRVYAGGPPAMETYLSLIDGDGEVRFFNLVGSLVDPSSFTPIAANSLRQFGYEGERHLEYLYPHRIIGQIDKKLLISLENRCYECRDNPGERSLYLFSFEPFLAEEISFCFNYESPTQTCFDSSGKYIDP